ncbi:MAG: FAD-dependent monooxygenase [Hyphomicrobiales bacterium]|nr:FAD-dependent monooxygenase [Hyphomicrobiales bacterium]
MRDTDIAIVGAGLAGSIAAAMLGRAGVATVLVDPHKVYPEDFRCEKLDASQVALLRKTGLAEPVLSAATPDLEVSIARFGRLVERRPNGQYDILYHDLVNVVRGQVPPTVELIVGKAASIATCPERQRLTLTSGEEISARLIVLANGLNLALRESIGIDREVRSACHSISIGFDLLPIGRDAFDFRALTYYPERATDRMAYLTLFPIGTTMRANLFVYRGLDDPWLAQMRRNPVEALFALMPGLRRLTGKVEVRGVKMRPVDLYVSTGHRQGGVVLVGDAFSTSCPAAGTGCNKVFTDVERLCAVHVPRWLATPGMEAEKICAFYDDPVKVACEIACADEAYYLRSLSTAIGLPWTALRLGRFVGQAGAGALRHARELIAPRAAAAPSVPANARER